MQQTTTKERVMKVTQPENPLSYNEWVEKYRFGQAYIKPTQYFAGNEFDTRRFGGTSSIPKVSWQNYLLTPFKIILNLGTSLW